MSAERQGFSFRPAFQLMGGRILGFVATFFVPVVLARVFVPEVFGTKEELFLVYTTLYGLAQIGMAESLFYQGLGALEQGRPVLRQLAAPPRPVRQRGLHRPVARPRADRGMAEQPCPGALPALDRRLPAAHAGFGGARDRPALPRAVPHGHRGLRPVRRVAGGRADRAGTDRGRLALAARRRRRLRRAAPRRPPDAPGAELRRPPPARPGSAPESAPLQSAVPGRGGGRGGPDLNLPP